MRIANHILTGDDPLLLPYEAAANIDEVMVPDLVVLHETASPLEKGNSARFLRMSTAVSVHFVVERDGAIRQQAPTNRACDHAGQSIYHGRRGCNAFSIGIELVGPGIMQPGGAGLALAWWGERFDIGASGIVALETRAHGAGLWLPFSPAQIESLIALLAVLVRDVPTLRDIRGHWYVSPGRKIDPNPTLDIERLRSLVLGRTDPAEAQADAAAVPAAGWRSVATETPGDTLSLRRWPSVNPNVLARIPHRTVLAVLAEGRFDGRRWLRVGYGGHEGWIAGLYTREMETS